MTEILFSQERRRYLPQKTYDEQLNILCFFLSARFAYSTCTIQTLLPQSSLLIVFGGILDYKGIAEKLHLRHLLVSIILVARLACVVVTADDSRTWTSTTAPTSTLDEALP